MRKFLTTLLAATAIAAPAAATTVAGEPDGPRDRAHARQGDSDDGDRGSNRGGNRGGNRDGARSSDGGSDRSMNAERPRFERPQVERTQSVERPRFERSPQAEASSDRPDRGPPSWKSERPSGADAGTMERPRIRERPTPVVDTPQARVTEQRRRSGTVVDRPGDGYSPNNHSLIRRDGPRGSFNSPTTHRGDDHQWNRTWRDDRRYDWRNYRDRNRSIFRLGFYYDPYGYQYRRWNIGWSMRPYYYQSNYWINDPWQYRLPQVYGPYRWVRYFDDAILVNTWTGEVEDVIYNFFW